MRQRRFSGEADKLAMISLGQLAPADHVHVVDLPYRLSSWAVGDPGNAGLWVDAQGQLLAWAVMQAPFWTIDYALHPDAGSTLHREVLAWADHRARALRDTAYGHPCWFVVVFAGQADRIRDLEEAGFACQANVEQDPWSKVLMERPARLPVADQAMPGGFRIRPLAGEKEVHAYVALHRAVFESKNMTAGWRRRILHRPEYLADLDLVAEAPDGQLVAFCICWLSQGLEPAGQIEPLGVHADYRNLGVGQAILSEGLRRLYLQGAARVHVETDKHRNAALQVYEAAGFRTTQDVLVYRRDY